MTPTTIALIGTASLIAITFTRMSIGVVMGLVGVVGFGLITGVGPALGLLKTVPYTSFADETLCVLPLFLLMGNFAFNAGMSEDMYRTAYVWLGRFRGRRSGTRSFSWTQLCRPCLGWCLWGAISAIWRR